METKFWVETSESLDFVEECPDWDTAYARIMEMESEAREALSYKPGQYCISEVEIDESIPSGFEYIDRTYVINAKD